MDAQIHNKILEKLTQIEAKIGTILTKLEYVEKQIEGHEGRITNLEQRVGALEVKNATVDVRAEQFATNWKQTWAVVVAFIAAIASFLMNFITRK